MKIRTIYSIDISDEDDRISEQRIKSSSIGIMIEIFRLERRRSGSTSLQVRMKWIYVEKRTRWELKWKYLYYDCKRNDFVDNEDEVNSLDLNTQ